MIQVLSHSLVLVPHINVFTFSEKVYFLTNYFSTFLLYEFILTRIVFSPFILEGYLLLSLPYVSALKNVLI